MDIFTLDLDAYLDAIWSRLLDMHGGLDNPFEYRERLEKLIETGEAPEPKTDQSKGSKGGAPRLGRITEAQKQQMREIERQVNERHAQLAAERAKAETESG